MSDRLHETGDVNADIFLHSMGSHNNIFPTIQGHRQLIDFINLFRTPALETELAESPEHDPDNPKNWPAGKKAAIALFVLVCAFVATIGTPIYIAAVPGVAESFNVIPILAIAPASFYAFGLGFGALLATASSEVFGQPIIYRVTLPLSLAFTIASGAAKNYVALAAARSLAGLFSGSCVTVGAGVINDLWNVSLEKAGTAVAVLFAMVIIWAIQVGPMMSGSLLTNHSWRWTFWTIVVLVSIEAVSAFLIPETYYLQIIHSRDER